MVNLNIKLDEKDRRDLHYIVYLMNTSCDVINNFKDIEILTEDQYRDYLQAAMDCLFESRMNMYKLRKKFQKKYNIPFNFISINGDIYIEDNSDGN